MIIMISTIENKYPVESKYLWIGKEFKRKCK